MSFPEQTTDEDTRLAARNDLAVAIATLEAIATSADYPEQQRHFAQVALTRLLQAAALADPAERDALRRALAAESGDDLDALRAECAREAAARWGQG